MCSSRVITLLGTSLFSYLVGVAQQVHDVGAPVLRRLPQDAGRDLLALAARDHLRQRPRQTARKRRPHLGGQGGSAHFKAIGPSAPL